MGKEWRRFFWPMVTLVAILIGVTVHSYLRYGAEFWNTFYPQFLATVFGVVFSIMFAWALWRFQQRAQESHKRRQLIKDLKFEVDENSKRLEDVDVILDESRRPAIGSTDVVTLKGFSFGEHSVRLLRTAAMKQILKPENLLLVSDPALEDDIDWLLKRIELYNATLFEAFDNFYSDIDFGKDKQKAIADLRLRILPGFRFLQGFIHGLSLRLQSYRLG